MLGLTGRDARGRRQAEDVHASNILVALSGSELDRELVRLACNTAKAQHGLVYVVRVVEVPREHPLDAALDNTAALGMLDEAIAEAEKVHFEVDAELIQAREAGSCLVDEANARECDLIVMGLVPRTRFGQFHLGDTVPYVLAQAPCRVWVVRDCARTQQGTAGK